MLGGALHLYLSLDNLYWLPLDHPLILCNYLNHKKFPSEEKGGVVLDSVRMGRTLQFTVCPDMCLPVLSW